MYAFWGRGKKNGEEDFQITNCFFLFKLRTLVSTSLEEWLVKRGRLLDINFSLQSKISNSSIIDFLEVSIFLTYLGYCNSHES